MKKILCVLLVFCCIFFISGCGKKSEKGVIKDFTKKIESSKGYHITGKLELISNDENYVYDVNVDYKADNFFRVSLVNQTNNHEQIILKNSDGVYVLTPSLNKSFKFQSDWPYNNSQSYLLQPIVQDIKNDSEYNFSEIENGYVITTVADYPNNSSLIKQKIYLDKDSNITKVEVVDANDQAKIIMNFETVDLNATTDDEYYLVENNVLSNIQTDKPVSSFDEIIFPMYIPTDTYLNSQDVINTDNGQRVILTFNGASSFTVIQETASINDEISTVSVDGDLCMVMDTVGSISKDSVNWSSNGIDYYVISNNLSTEELASVANSISIMPVGK